MRVLIVTEPDDLHAVLVKLALEKKGTSCDLFFSGDMPSKQKNNIFISADDYSWDSINDANKVYSFAHHFDSIWWRRPKPPHIPTSLHIEDKPFVDMENSIYHDSIPHLLNDGACWINPIASHQKSRSKLVQLKLAKQCNFKLPETLISNSPIHIKAFIQANKKQNVIYKAFSSQFWPHEDGMKILYTDKLLMEDLPSDAILQAVPGIYQKYVDKKYELHVTCFGTHISAIRIDSKNNISGQTDWRKLPQDELSLTEVELPPHIRNKIILFMIKIGIVFGCFDFIVTPNDEFIFLELNDQGQFLWVENFIPWLGYLEIFSQFIINKRFDFSWKKSTKQPIYVADLVSQALDIVNDNMNNHNYQNQLNNNAQ